MFGDVCVSATIYLIYTMGRLSSLLLPILVINIAFTGFGVNSVVLKLYGKTLNPLTYITARAAGAVPLLFLAAAMAERAKPARPQSMKEALLLLAIGFVVAIFFSAGILGVLFAGAAVATVLFMTLPVTSILIAVLTRTEPVPSLCQARGIAKVGGILVTVTGAILLVVGGKKSKKVDCREDKDLRYDDDQPVIGAIMCTVCMIVTGFYFAATKRFFLKYTHWKVRPISSSAWIGLTMFLSLSIIMPIGLLIPYHTCAGRKVYPSFAELQVWTISGEGIYSVEYGIFISSCLSMMLITWSLTRLPPSVASAFSPVGQLIAVLLAAVLLNDKLTILQYSSMLFIIIGLLCVVWSQHKEEQMEQAKRKQQEGGDEREKSSENEIENDPSQCDCDTAKLLEMEVITTRTEQNGELVFVDDAFSESDEEDEL